MESDVVRQQGFDAEGVVEIDVALLAGRVRVHLVDEPGVHVEVRQEEAPGESWTAGLSNLLTWVNDQFGDRAQPAGPGEAVRDARVEFADGRLTVRSSQALPLRAAPLGVVVRAPHGSHVRAKLGSADLTVLGSAGKLEIRTDSGDVTADQVGARAKVDSRAGKVRLGPVLGGLNVKTGSGDIEVSSIGGNAVLYTGTGHVWLGAVEDDVQVRTGSGDVTVADAASGRLQMGTGAGDVRVGVRPGVAAEVDLASTSGTARSELEVSATPPEQGPNLFITGRTGTGTALVTTATTA
ncbi:DUF4097 family beta strand repeat-containing protein [Saccharothrix lopnurensis]|uniref:DUF4097 domain-containing protein n=1 Tax=Saccharothrix lopnurensis TaxID=1670621 RepID=A0ABW1PBN7_9PSEU